MLTPVSMKDIPMVSHPRTRLEEADLKYSKQDEKSPMILDGILALAHLMKGPVLVTLGSNSPMLIQELRRHFPILLFFQEGDSYKIQAQLLNPVELPISIRSEIAVLFGIQKEIQNPSPVQAYRKSRDEDLLNSEESQQFATESITRFLEHELLENQGYLALPMSNLPLQEVDQNPYLAYLASRFHAVYLIGCGEPWTATHLIVSDTPS